MWRGRSTNIGDKVTDIQVVNYYSDGRFLNATLWLGKFNKLGPSDRRLNYGMYIDSDFNKMFSPTRYKVLFYGLILIA